MAFTCLWVHLRWWVLLGHRDPLYIPVREESQSSGACFICQWQETGLSMLTSSLALPWELLSCSKWDHINHRLRITKNLQISVTLEEHTCIVGCASSMALL